MAVTEKVIDFMAVSLDGYTYHVTAHNARMAFLENVTTADLPLNHYYRYRDSVTPARPDIRWPDQFRGWLRKLGCGG